MHHKRGIPKLHKQIDRPHLRDAFAHALDYRVILLSAPPGCGKTTLASQFAESVDCPLIWHSINNYQQDMRVMVSNLFQSLADFVPDVQTLNKLIEQPPEVIAHGLTQLLEEFTSEDFILVLDDWHRFNNNHPANQWLRTFITFMPENCHLLILSQTIPPLDMLTMVARGEILAIPQEDLYFTEAEVYLLAAKLQSKLDAEELELVWKRMKGWAAGTILTLQPGSSSLLKNMNDDNTPSDALFQSIARDMLKQQAPDVQQFLRWTSTIEKFDSTICGEDVLRLADWQLSLPEIIKNNLFIQEDGLGYKYHDLFRKFLQTHFRLTRPEEYAEAHRRVAVWYERQGEIDRAIHHYLEAKAFHHVVDLVESIAQSYFIQGRIESLRAFGVALSERNLKCPKFDYVQSRIALDYDKDTQQALEHANYALNTFDEKENTLWYYRTRYQSANIVFFQGYYDRAREICDEILPHIKDFKELYGLVLSRRGLAYYFLSDLESAILDLEEARPLLEEYSGWLEQSRLLQDMELVYRDLGQKEPANDCLHGLIKLRRLLDNREELAIALNSLGYLYYVEGHYEDARNAYKDGLETIQLLETGRSRYFIYASQGDLERDCGRYEKAREHYQDALALVGDNEPYMRCETLTHLATLYRWQGRAESAITCTNEAMQLAKQHQLMTAYKQAQIEAMHIKLQPYNIRTIEEEARSLNGKGTSVEELVLQLRLAHFHKDNPAVDKILAILQKQYDEGMEIPGFFAELANNPQLTAIRQKMLLDDTASAEHLQRLLDASELVRPVIIPMMPPTSSIEVFSLGAEIVRQDGNRVSDSDWQSPTARELFLYFVFHKAPRRDEVCLVFWKDKSTELAIDLFHKMLGKARQTIGQKTIIYDEENDRYRIDSDIYLWCDAHRVDTLVEEAQKLGVSSLHALEIWKKATDLLTGEFLPELDRQWISELRSKYEKLTVKAWMKLGQCYMAQDDYHAAVQAFQMAARHDDLYEEAYRGQMICWAKLGERARIIYTYNLLKTSLKTINVNPSAQTNKLLIDLLA